MALTTPTNAHFPRFDPPTDFDAPSPSRSPRRKAQFAIKELDPLLANLSPDSTLKALRATETIPGGAAQDALTTSIVDASSSEREIGIRAAFAAQKLREWRTEVTQWKWPNKRERTLGLGFTTPPSTETTGVEYLGSLPIDLVEQYEGRLEEIRDDLDSLGIEEIKDHVLEAHVPATKSASTTIRPIGVRTSYGRMRDFTALITATVIQALPDLAKLNILLDEWDIRLKVLRSLPKFRLGLAAVQSEIHSAIQELRDPELSRHITDVSYDNKKLVLGEQVSDLGRRADRLLDILEGHEDSLPQIWIDRLEKIELDYATWAVDAQHTALKNKLSPSTTSTPEKNAITKPEVVASSSSAKSTQLEPDAQHLPAALQPVAHVPPESGTSSSTEVEQEPKAKRKPSLTIALPESRGHRREASKVSVADSTLSAFSDISNAEIIDVTRTSVLPSPKINVVENPLKPSGEESIWFGSQPTTKPKDGRRPPMLQRASTTSIEVVPNHQLKRVLLTRSASWDMLSNMPESPAPSTPSKALKQLAGLESPKAKSLRAGLDDPSTLLKPGIPSLDPTPLPSPSPSLLVEPLRVRTKSEDLAPVLPSLPRKSSKRNTIATVGASSPLTPISSASPVTPVIDQGLESLSRKTSRTPTEQTTPKHRKTASLDEKIQDLLTSLPTKIRLAKDSDSSSLRQASSTSSTRASTPTPALTLSAVKNEPSSRKSSVGDSEIRLYHLTRAGQARDTPPVKLFVRTIGDGNRVMVRVGGGWADLGEYLKEYSLHHGSRTTGDGQLEVASFPINGKRDSVNSPNVNGGSGTQGRRKSRSPVIAQTAFENSSPSNLQITKPRSVLTKPRPTDRGDGIVKDEVTWTPPPVPAIPASFTTMSPTMKTTSSSDGAANTDIIDSDPSIPSNALSFADPDTPSGTRSSTIISDGVTTTTVVTPPTTGSTSYTPLGAAGPKINSKRATTYGGLPTASRDAWVEGIVGKARAVSGGAQTITNGPTTTTTTTTTISTPKSRRASLFGSSPRSSPASVGTVSPSTSTGSGDPDSKSRRVSLMPGSRPKSRMSLGDIGGIKRVFLRKKTGDPIK
jgi:hypothetical protein